MAWPWQDRAGMLLGRAPVCPHRPRHAGGSALESLGLTPPRAGFELGLAPRCTPKASFLARGVIGVGTKSLWGSWGHGQAGRVLWDSPGSPLVPGANVARVRGGNGVDPHLPALPSQPTVGSAGGGSSNRASKWSPTLAPYFVWGREGWEAGGSMTACQKNAQPAWPLHPLCPQATATHCNLEALH